jgi:hypothetical protein
MRRKLFLSCAVASFALLLSLSARAQDAQQPEDEVVRGAFITTRPAAQQSAKKETASKPDEGASAKTTANLPNDTPTAHKSTKESAKPKSSRTTAQGAHANPKSSAPKTPPKTAPKSAPTETAKNSDGSQGGAKFVKAAVTPASIGVGYTIFGRDEAGSAVRVDPKREFKSGDAIRILIESNTDGYLYIFDAENDETPSLIFPNARLNGGDNRISAHVPYEIPSSAERDETLRWFVFNETPATERVYVVVSRQPLAGVPTGDRLAQFCAGKDVTCAWKPTGDEWARVKGINRRDEIAMSSAKDMGLAQTVAEREATSRGLGLSANAPPPTVIYMASSRDANALVTTVDLVHKK